MGINVSPRTLHGIRSAKKLKVIIRDVTTYQYTKEPIVLKSWESSLMKAEHSDIYIKSANTARN